MIVVERLIEKFRRQGEGLADPGGQFSYDRFVFGESEELFGAGDRTTIARRENNGYEATYIPVDVLDREFIIGRRSVHIREIPNFEGVEVLVAGVEDDRNAARSFTWMPHSCKPSDRMNTIEVAFNNQRVFERPVGVGGEGVVLRCDVVSNTIQIIDPNNQITIRYL